VVWWSKDIFLILFGSRTGEVISLGIGMKILDYLLIGLILPLSGLAISLEDPREKILSFSSQFRTDKNKKHARLLTRIYRTGILGVHNQANIKEGFALRNSIHPSTSTSKED
jgi:hypothetical protein